MPMERLKVFDPELVTRSFPEEDLRKDPERINYGWCMRWAYIAYLMFEDVELCSMGSHAFIKYRGRFYDSERLEGVERWQDLPACNSGVGCGCKECKKGLYHHTENDFKQYWMGNCNTPDWPWYEQLAMETLNAIRGL